MEFFLKLLYILFLYLVLTVLFNVAKELWHRLWIPADAAKKANIDPSKAGPYSKHGMRGNQTGLVEADDTLNERFYRDYER